MHMLFLVPTNYPPLAYFTETPDIVSVSAKHHGLMVEGTDFQLNCDIINVAPVQKLKVKWYRGNETVHTETFNGTSATPVNVTSSFVVTPERDYNGTLFRCEAELHLGPNGPELIPTKSSSPYTAVVNCEFSTHLFIIDNYKHPPLIYMNDLFMLMCFYCR